MVIELRVVQFWSEIILVISNRTHAARSFDFEITRMISDQIALHLVQLPLLTGVSETNFSGIFIIRWERKKETITVLVITEILRVKNEGARPNLGKHP